MSPETDPLACLVTLLKPRTVLSKVVEGAGEWGVRYPRIDTAGFGLVISGHGYLTLEGSEPLRIERGDFVLMPHSPGFTLKSALLVEAAPTTPTSVDDSQLRLRHGRQGGEPDFELLGGYFTLESANATLLQELLPPLIHIGRSQPEELRLKHTVDLITDEISHLRPGRDLVLERLVEVLLVEAIRIPAEFGLQTKPGLLKGLGDPEVARALRAFHADVAHPWTVAQMAEVAGLSRSAFSEKFRDVVGSPCMEYVTHWRIALAKDRLKHQKTVFEELAHQIGYQSASAFSTAFKRQTGCSPREFSQRA